MDAEEAASLKQKMEEQERIFEEMRKEKEQFEKQLEEAKKIFEQRKVEDKVDNKNPFLSNINQDMAMSGMIKRPLKAGPNVVGKQT